MLPSDIWQHIASFLRDDTKTLIQLTHVCQASRWCMRSKETVSCRQPPPASCKVSFDCMISVSHASAWETWIARPELHDRVSMVHAHDMSVTKDLAVFGAAKIILERCQVDWKLSGLTIGKTTQLEFVRLQDCEVLSLPPIRLLCWDGRGIREACPYPPLTMVCFLEEEPDQEAWQVLQTLVHTVCILQNGTFPIHRFLMLCDTFIASNTETQMPSLQIVMAPRLRHLSVSGYDVEARHYESLQSCYLSRCRLHFFAWNGCQDLCKITLERVFIDTYISLQEMPQLEECYFIHCFFFQQMHLMVTDNPMLHTFLLLPDPLVSGEPSGRQAEPAETLEDFEVSMERNPALRLFTWSEQIFRTQKEQQMTAQITTWLETMTLQGLTLAQDLLQTWQSLLQWTQDLSVFGFLTFCCHMEQMNKEPWVTLMQDQDKAKKYFQDLCED